MWYLHVTPVVMLGLIGQLWMLKESDCSHGLFPERPVWITAIVSGAIVPSWLRLF